jgi:4-diphosphocytidyl-2-C-methyl-D-erythritol kinase
MKFIAPAKINLNLNITGRRDDGYHTLDSIMTFTQWADEITITPSDRLQFAVDGPYASIFTPELLSVERDSPNLIIRALWMMADTVKKEPNFKIQLTKNIPAGAGLGGGSSDAAVIMKALNKYWNMALSMDELCAMGLALGAELPVCLHGTSARVTGIGDIIEPVNIPPQHILITWPDHELSTIEVFTHYRQSGLPFTQFDGDWQSSQNDLTGASIELCPHIGELLSILMDCDGCKIARMGGSGSSCFGIFETAEQAQRALKCFTNGIVTQIN